jgi:hypothetical protein
MIGDTLKAHTLERVQGCDTIFKTTLYEGVFEMEKQTQSPCSKVMKPTDHRLDSDIDSTSQIDREEINGGHRKTNWKDARKMALEKNKSASMTPTLEDGAD